MPLTYDIASIICGVLLVIGLFSVKADWRVPYVAALVTIAAWYLVEPVYTPEQFDVFVPQDISDAFLSVIIFLVGFAVFVPLLVNSIAPSNVSVRARFVHIEAEGLVMWVVITWLVLLAYGTYLLNGDLFTALFPMKSRAGVQMWSRAAGADAGPTGFIISAAGYLYVLCTAAFGLLLFLVRRPETRFVLVGLIVISWPYAFFMGARSTFLAVCVPGVISYMLFARHPKWLKAIVLAGTAQLINILLLMIIRYRGAGFGPENTYGAAGTTHLGLNMSSELAHELSFLRTGAMQIDYGWRYFAEALNVVPRAIWSAKPMLGIDYSLARGFASTHVHDIGVAATVSTGVIGQGVLAFGPWLGPLVAALLLAFWVAALTRFWRQGTPPRLVLFLLGLGLTFNLGRDLTLLVLWPIIFAYLAVRVIERVQTRNLERRKALLLRRRGLGE